MLKGVRVMNVENKIVNVNNKNRADFVKYVYENGESIYKILKEKLDDKSYIENIFQDLIIESYENFTKGLNLEQLVIEFLEKDKPQYKYRRVLRVEESDVKEEIKKVRKMNLRKEKVIHRFIIEEIKEKFSLKEEDIIYKNIIINLNNFNFRDYNGEIKTANPKDSIVFLSYVITKEKIYELDLNINYENINIEKPYLIESFENIKQVTLMHGILKIVFKNEQYILLRSIKENNKASFASYSMEDSKTANYLEEFLRAKNLMI